MFSSLLLKIAFCLFLFYSKNIAINETNFAYDDGLEDDTIGYLLPLGYELGNVAVLRQLLLAGYDKDNRPVMDSSRPLLVCVDSEIEQISHLDEVYQVSDA